MEKFCLKWNDFQSNVSKTFSTLRKEQDFFDITLLSDDGEAVSAHKVVLSASSEFFKSVLRKADHSKPMIYLNGVDYKDLNHILDYIYEGQVQLYQEDLDSFLEVAQKLKINGLIGGQEEKENNTKDVKDQDDHVEVLENTQSFYTKDIKPNFEVKNKGTKVDRTVSVVAEQGTNVYEEAKRAVDQLVMKVGDSWVCKTCDKSAKTNCQIRKHAEIHIEGLSFPCQLCGDTFRSRIALSNHKINKHSKV